MLHGHGTPRGTRTPNFLVRSETLYPIESPGHGAHGLIRTNDLLHVEQTFYQAELRAHIGPR